MNDLASPTLTCIPQNPDIYDPLPQGVLVINAAGIVAYANRAANSLLLPMQPRGLPLHTLFDLARVSGAEPLVQAVLKQEPAPPVKIMTAAGRILDSTVQPLGDGRSLLTLYDVSHYVHAAERAARDTLTGVLTRAGLDERLTSMLADCRRTGIPLALIYIDLDKFKAVNDTLGHPVGDALLLKVAERLRSATRTDDLIARLGGDEFAVLLSAESMPAAAETLAARIVDLLSRTYIAAGHMITIGASVGIAVAPADGDDATTLLKRADIALYQAKAEGRGCFRFFVPDMDKQVQQRRQMETDLRRALALKEFELFYQPQVNLSDNRLTGFEALLRWRSPSRGLVSPSVFIPLAEEIGLINRIGDWVLRTACAQAVKWPDPVTVAVNISPLHFRSGKLLASVEAVLSATGLPARRLEIEITETTFLQNTDCVMATLHALKSLGIGISMDDFGTGYSSLSYLQQFPFDKIKIDQSFVRTEDRASEAEAIVRAMASLGRDLGVMTLAEGVETVEQLDRIRADGCGAVQGFLTGRPLSADAATQLLGGALPSTLLTET